MKLIAKKPCSFGGRQFFIGEEIPKDLVLYPSLQEQLGVISVIAEAMEAASAAKAGTFTQEQVDSMIAEAVEAALRMAMENSGELHQEEAVGYGKFVEIPIQTEEGEGQKMSLPMTPEQVIQALAILQMTVEEGLKKIAEVKDENILILLHAADSRKTIKNAAKEQAGKLFSYEGISNGACPNNGHTDTTTEGS